MIWTLSKWQWRLIPGGLSILVIGALLKTGMMQPLEQAGYQMLFQFRGVQPWDDRLALIAIDDPSLTQMGRFPWPRRHYAKLLQVLQTADANVVVFDLLFSEPSADDRLLAATMQQQNNVVLAQAWDAEGAPLLPVPVLQQNALGSGHILARQDSDGIIRQVSSQIKGIPALGVAAGQAYSLMHAPVTLPTTPVWLNWVGRADAIPQYSFAEVEQGKVNPHVFSNKIVLVGVTATGIDPLVTPFDRNPPAGSVVLHATLIQNLLQQSTLKSLSLGWMVLLFLVGGPLFSWGLLGQGWLRQTLAITASWAIWIGLSVFLLKADRLVPVVPPLALFLLTGSATAVCDRLRESASLQQKLHTLEQSGALQEEFLRTASHELRSPVANIQSLISLLRMAKSAEEWEEYLQILEEECHQESALINDLLDFQRIGKNSQPPQLETYDLKDWLDEVTAPFVFRAATHQQTIQVQLESASLPLILDWLSLRRIVSELLNNACKYTPSQHLIRVTAQIAAGQLEVLVSNAGVAFSPEELTKLFEPFYRNVDVDYRQQGGTGLGLAIIQRLAEHLGGAVTVDNQASVLTFTVRLPVAVASADPAASLPEFEQVNEF